MSANGSKNTSVLLSMQKFIVELQRRKVVRVALVYVAFAWLLVQFSDIISNAFAAPDWVMRVLVLFLILALPATLILAWLFDITPSGIRLTTEAGGDGERTLNTIMLISNGSIDDYQSANDLCEHLSRKLRIEIDLFGGKIYGLHHGHCVVEFPDSTPAVSCGLRILELLKDSQRPASLSIACGSFSHANSTLSGQALRIAESISYPEHDQQHLILSMAVYERELSLNPNPLLDYCQSKNFTLNQHDLQAVLVDPAALDNPAIQWRLKEDTEDTQLATSGHGRHKAWLAFSLILIAAFSWLYLEYRQPGNNLPQSLAIMPFRVLDQGDESKAIALGLNEELHDSVRQLKALQLTSSRSSRVLADQELAVPALGERLNVNYLLEGSARKIGDEYRISIQLADTSNGNTLWSHIYQSNQADMYTVQEDIIRQLARIFKIQPTEESPATELGKEDYGLYLEAIGYFELPNNTLYLERAETILKQLLNRHLGYSSVEAALCKLHLIRFNNTNAVTHLSQAISFCELAKQGTNGNPAVLNTLAQISLAKAEFNKANRYVEEGLALEPDSLELLMTSANIGIKTGQLKKSEKVLLQAIATNPWFWRLHDMLGMVYMDSGRLDESVAMLQTAAELMPTDAGIYNKLGAVYFSMGEFSNAALAFEKSLELLPNNAAYSNIGTVYYFAGDFEKSREYNLKATELTPQNYISWRNLGDSEWAIPGKQDAALSHYQLASKLAKEVLEVSPDNAAALSSLAWMMAQTEAAKNAEKYILRALKLAPNDANTLYDASGIYARLGQNDKALELIQAAISAGIPAAVIAATPGLQGLYTASSQTTKEPGDEHE